MVSERADLIMEALRDFSAPQVNQIYEVEMESARQQEVAQKDLFEHLAHDLRKPVTFLDAIVEDPDAKSGSDSILARGIDWLRSKLATQKAILQAAGRPATDFHNQLSLQHSAVTSGSSKCSLQALFHLNLAYLFAVVCYDAEFQEMRKALTISNRAQICSMVFSTLTQKGALEKGQQLKFDGWPTIETTFEGPNVYFMPTGTGTETIHPEGYLYCLLSLWIDELLRNTLRHQYRASQLFRPGTNLTMKVTTALDDMKRTTIRFRFAPVPNFTAPMNPKCNGLRSLARALKPFGYLSLHMAQGFAEVPYFGDVEDSNWREWGITLVAEILLSFEQQPARLLQHRIAAFVSHAA